MPDATIVRAHQQTATGRKKGRRRGSLTFPRGLSTKIHLLVNGPGDPVAFRLTAGQATEFNEALPLLAGRQAGAVLADRGYGSNAAVEVMGSEAVIPSKSCRKVQRPHNRERYTMRNRIERCFNQLKHFGRLVTRSCK